MLEELDYSLVKDYKITKHIKGTAGITQIYIIKKFFSSFFIILYFQNYCFVNLDFV